MNLTRAKISPVFFLAFLAGLVSCTRDQTPVNPVQPTPTHTNAVKKPAAPIPDCAGIDFVDDPSFFEYVGIRCPAPDPTPTPLPGEPITINLSGPVPNPMGLFVIRNQSEWKTYIRDPAAPDLVVDFDQEMVIIFSYQYSSPSPCPYAELHPVFTGLRIEADRLIVSLVKRATCCSDNMLMVLGIPACGTRAVRVPQCSLPVEIVMNYVWCGDPLPYGPLPGQLEMIDPGMTWLLR